MNNPRETLLLNATSTMAMTSFAKQICEDAEYNPQIASQGVEIFVAGLRKGLEEHCGMMKLDSENPEVPDFIKGFFQEPANQINKEVDEALDHVCSFIRDKLYFTVQTICTVQKMVNKTKGESTSTETPDIDDSGIKDIFEKFVNKISEPQEKSEAPKPEASSRTKAPGQYDQLFVHHSPGPKRVKKHEGLREFAIQYARYMEETIPASPERTLAIRKLQETLMWANAALAINEKE